MRIDVELGDNDGAPVRIRLGEDWLSVTEVLDRWLAREHRYFKLCAGGDRYILRHDIPNGVWDMTFFVANGSS